MTTDNKKLSKNVLEHPGSIKAVANDRFTLDWMYEKNIMGELKVYLPRDGTLNVNQDSGDPMVVLWRHDGSKLPLPMGSSQTAVKAGECLWVEGDNSKPYNIQAVTFSYEYVS